MDGRRIRRRFRVLADHARAVAFLLADGVFPSNEGRGYVLRRILRRAVRHAWLLGRREPTLVHVVQAVIDTMGDVYPELRLRAKHFVDTTRAEEERFLDDDRRRDVALRRTRARAGRTAQGSPRSRARSPATMRSVSTTRSASRSISRSSWRASADTRSTSPGSSAALDAQRTQSQEERRSRRLTVVRRCAGRAAAVGVSGRAGAECAGRPAAVRRLRHARGRDAGRGEARPG